MMNVHTELPIGAKSRGFDRVTEEEATEVFDRVVSIVRTWENYTLDVVMMDEGQEVRREHITNA